MKELRFIVFIGSMLFLNVKSVFSQSPAPVIQWEKTYGGHYDEDGYDIIQTQDGGYVMVGNVESYDGDFTGDVPIGIDTTYGISMMGIIKTDAQGNIQWHKLLKTVVTTDGPLGFPNDYAYAVIQNSDGDYIVAGGGGGSDPSRLEVLKLNSTGDYLDSMAIGGGDGAMARDIHQTLDGGYIVAGYAGPDAHDGGMVMHNPQYDPGEDASDDWWILKLDANLDVQWQKDYGSIVDDISSGYDQLYSCAQTPDSGFVFAGSSGGGHNYDVPVNNTTDEGYSDAWIIKTDKSGNILWNKIFGGGWYDEATSIKTTFDHGFIVGGYYKENSGDLGSFPLVDGSWIFKLDSMGNLEWQKSIEAYGYSNSSVAQTTDSGYVLTTRTYQTSDNSMAYGIIKFDQNGNQIWEGNYGGSGWDEPKSIEQTADGGFILMGSTNSDDGDVTGLHGGYDFWVVKLGTVMTGIKELSKRSDIKVYPNPAANVVNFSKTTNVKVYSLNGRLLLEQKRTHQIDISGLSSGSYLFELFDDQNSPIQLSNVIKE